MDASQARVEIKETVDRLAVLLKESGFTSKLVLMVYDQNKEGMVVAYRNGQLQEDLPSSRVLAKELWLFLEDM